MCGLTSVEGQYMLPTAAQDEMGNGVRGDVVSINPSTINNWSWLNMITIGGRCFLFSFSHDITASFRFVSSLPPSLCVCVCVCGLTVHYLLLRIVFTI